LIAAAVGHDLAEICDVLLDALFRLRLSRLAAAVEESHVALVPCEASRDSLCAHGKQSGRVCGLHGRR